MSYLGEGSDFRQQNKPKPMKVPAGTTGPGSGYTPGGDSYKNYSQQDQQKMFQQAGGEKQFKENVANIEQKYKRSADIQRYLDRTNLFNKFQNRGDGIVKDAQGRTILSMQSPYMTAQAPTFGQLLGDMGRGIGSIFQGIAEKGTPLMQLGKGVLGGIQNFFSNTFNPGNISGQLKAAGPQAQQQYAMLMQQPGMTYQKAFEMATGNPFIKDPAPKSSSNLNLMQTSESLNNLTEFGQLLADRVRNDQPGITEAELFSRLQRMNNAGFAAQGRPVFTTGMFAKGGVASL